MRMLGNILWHFPFLGFMTAFLTFLLGSLLTILIIPAPIGLGLIQLSKFLLAPYSYSMVSKDDLNINQNPAWKTYSFIIMLLYLPIGIIAAVVSAMQVLGLFLTIIGIPMAIPLAKSLGTYLNPVGKVCVPVETAEAIRLQKVYGQAQDFAKK
ncbi:YccF domain-containing protein [Desulfovibrio litoralis]|uniref:Uncharacterized membrane protein YccF, DUF307 family n=1 Tax=Desulfovibrio litoralis DSM 11393 TaxID=1121455 RepID=A0A1M7TDH4_9BACT|nr:YccF domain-containing protein [Desulfovibrio litoralis]SHN68726.1 Uncharacterized membrane protein YccF, DUF307 family [Desulfovibrio litoralis DSM 11393]